MIIVNTTPPTLRPQDIQRFWERVDKSPNQGPQGECWAFTGSRDKDGYGFFSTQGRVCRSHRIAFFIETGEWPAVLICHVCDWPPCCRPEHLFSGSVTVNNQDCTNKGRRARGSRSGAALHPERIARGSRNGFAKLTEQKAMEILNLKGSTSVKQIAQSYKISVTVVYRIFRREAWKHI